MPTLQGYQGQVIRRTYLDQATLEQLLSDDDIAFKEFLSTTKSQQDVKENSPYRLLIHSKHGKLIEPFSLIPAEEEVLFTAGTRFKIINRTKGTDTDDYLWQFELQEYD